MVTGEQEDRTEPLAASQGELLVDVEVRPDRRGCALSLPGVRGAKLRLEARNVPVEVGEVHDGCAWTPTYLMHPGFVDPMASRTFVELASGLIAAMGQKMEAAKPFPEGLVLRTGDGFLYAFLEDPDQVSIDTIRRVLEEGDGVAAHLVVLTPGHLPLAISAEVLRRDGTLVEGPRSTERARQLGLDSYLGEAPRAPPATRPRLLPSAQLLDQAMGRARTWLEWGVPALALRLYRQAVELKPGFLPAKIGVGRALLGLGLTEEADRVFTEVVVVRPDDLDAWLGKAAVLGARARPKEEIEVYRALLAED